MSMIGAKPKEDFIYNMYTILMNLILRDYNI